MSELKSLSDMIENYGKIKAALPWLDVSYDPESAPFFSDFAYSDHSKYLDSVQLSKHSTPKSGRWLEKYPQVQLCLGHAGGRPGALDSVKKLCSEFSSVSVDISGDYFHHAMLKMLVDAVGVDKILFGSDVDWFDPRCVLGIILGEDDLNVEDKLKIQCRNAIKLYVKY